ncbi:hypothetical protein A6M21_01330 [Desulfotomaculum copahuensis]|uniref:PDZ domain-containing protein n=1 Tax=Desulfotomaculum copahuensis TaxID=1838280 RepID=A0A1B7LAY5_9FIRM|nr:hypothetical protein A6M21_01330 [Desulfotomaculum copahuensis]
MAAPVLALLLLFFFPLTACAAGNGIIAGINRVDEVMEYIYAHHINAPGAEQLTDGAIRGMIDSLGDPYTEYFTPAQLEQFTGALDGEYAGVGLELAGRPPYSQVTAVTDGSPAERAGVEKGDLITAVNGQSTENMPLPEVVDKVRGPAGSKVTLTLRRAGRADFSLTMERQTLSTPTIQWQIIHGRIGYINVHTFGSQTAAEFGAALRELKDKGATGLVLDLRNDPGGYLQAAVDVAGYFLPAGATVVTTVDRDGQKEIYRANGDALARGMPVAVLVNGMSASSAEVLAGALQDYGAATLVGERTYGKGVVQAVIPLETGGALKITIARYFTPRGRSIDGTGLTPDQEVTTPQLQLFAACRKLQPDTPWSIVFNHNGVQINGEKTEGDFAPLFRAGNAYLPLRFTLEALGYRVSWEGNGGAILVAGPAGRLVLSPGNSGALLNNRPVTVQQPVLEAPDKGMTYVSTVLLQKMGVVLSVQEQEIIIRGAGIK